jgi:ribosomal-protein-alanine N-acetyltransferase
MVTGQQRKAKRIVVTRTLDGMASPKTISDITFKLAQPGDATTIAHMSKRLIEVGLTWSWTPGRVAMHIRHRESVVLTARAAGELAGFAIMQFSDTSAHLDLFAVDPRYRRLGIGRRLLEWLEESAVTAGTFDIALEVRAANVGARWFYSKLGYREVRCIAGYYCRVETAVQMARDLRVNRPRFGRGLLCTPPFHADTRGNR